MPKLTYFTPFTQIFGAKVSSCEGGFAPLRNTVGNYPMVLRRIMKVLSASFPQTFCILSYNTLDLHYSLNAPNMPCNFNHSTVISL